MKQETISTTGSHSAWATGDGMKAEVRRGSKVVQKFKGEYAWSDAVREADDRNTSEKFAK